MQAAASPTTTTGADRRGHTSEGPRLSIRPIAGDLGVSISTAYNRSVRGRPWFPRSIRLPKGDVRVRPDWYEAQLEI
jgi:hypothetical protein